MTPPSGLSLEDVRIGLGSRELVAVDAAVPRGRILSVVGPSGVGKSTLLAHIAGFLDPSFRASGRVVLDGVDLVPLPPQRRRIGLMFQDDLLFPHLSVGRNVAFGLSAQAKGRDARRAAVETALGELGLAGMADRDPATLSGGERQRVALLRALLAEPRALLLDEPFSRLDRDTRREVRRQVFDRIAAADIPAVLVTHDAEDAEAAGSLRLDLPG